jgi:spermidine/putrescine transport system permease protein
LAKRKRGAIGAMNTKSFRALFFQESSIFLAMPAFIWVMLFLYLPLIGILGWSFVMHDQQHLPYLGLGNYATFFDIPFFMILKRSLILAFSTVISCLLIGYPIAYFLARKATRSKNILLFFLMLPFGVNILIQAYAWFFVLGREGLINTLFLTLGLINEPLSMLYTPVAVYIGMVYCYVPFMIMPIYAILEKLDQRFIEASMDLGASWFKTLRHVIIPLSLPGVSTGFFLVFIPVFGELVIPALLGGGRQMFVGSLISFYFLTTRNFAMGAAFTCLSSLVVMIVAFLVYWYFKRWRA